MTRKARRKVLIPFETVYTGPNPSQISGAGKCPRSPFRPGLTAAQVRRILKRTGRTITETPCVGLRARQPHEWREGHAVHRASGEASVDDVVQTLRWTLSCGTVLTVEDGVVKAVE